MVEPFKLLFSNFSYILLVVSISSLKYSIAALISLLEIKKTNCINREHSCSKFLSHYIKVYDPPQLPRFLCQEENLVSR